MARIRRDSASVAGTMPERLRTYRPEEWPADYESVALWASTFGAERMRAVVSRGRWTVARLEWLRARGFRSMREYDRAVG